MSIPDFQTLMLPVLRIAAEGEVRISDVVERLANDFPMSAEERSQLLPSGKQTTFANRVNWAKSYLGKAGLVELTSMLRDIERGAPIEADHIVGDLLRRKSAGTEPNSILRIAYAHLKAYEARRAREAGAAADRSRS
jgi:restriction endonuclease Mrr